MSSVQSVERVYGRRRVQVIDFALEGLPLESDVGAGLQISDVDLQALD